MALTHTEWLKILFCLVLGFLTSMALIPLLLQCTKRHAGLGRERDFHHAHTSRIGRLGGCALAAACGVVAFAISCLDSLSAASATALEVVVGGSLAMFALGFLDDWRALGARSKLIAQIVIAASVYFEGIRIEVLKNPLTGLDHSLGPFGFISTILWLVTFTNLINLIDGIDGLAAGVCLMLMCLLANLGMGAESGVSMLLPIGVAGGLVGFLRFNYPPARIYMGDGGAYFLGFLIGALSIVNSNKGTVVAALIAPAFALALPIVDVGLAILRRGLRGLPVFRPDRKHIHHYLITLGFSRERTVWILYTVSLLCLLLAFGVFWLQGRLLPLFSGLLFLLMGVAGHLSGFTKDWFAIGRQLGRSSALRKETRYALLLSQWLEMEVERHLSVEELWQDYHFVVSKLGFSRVTLLLPDGQNTWQTPGFDKTEFNIQTICHELNDGSILEFSGDRRILPEQLFSLLADLAAEIWHKAALRWQILHKAPLSLASPTVLLHFSPRKPFVRFDTPVEN